jgi:hypothetical protein
MYCNSPRTFLILFAFLGARVATPEQPKESFHMPAVAKRKKRTVRKAAAKGAARKTKKRKAAKKKGGRKKAKK